jgi:hypothetical protein
MNSAYQVSDITVAQVDRAYPLVDAAEVISDLPHWRGFCRRIITANGEGNTTERLLVCVNALGYLKGLCLAIFRQTEDGTVLDVPLHVVAAVLDEDGVREALRDRLRDLAAMAGCAEMHLPA